MNEINIMEGIDFKANKERIRSKKNKEKRVNKILNWIIIIGLIIAVIGILFINKNNIDSAMESCQNLGHSYNYCIAHV